jgi:hypothetical protein
VSQCVIITIYYEKGDAMRLQISRTKNAASFYVVKSVYADGKRTNKVHKKLGTYEELNAYSGTSGRRIRRHPDRCTGIIRTAFPAVSGHLVEYVF